MKMNNRIEELLKQSTHDVMGVKQVDQKQFAELIVRECVLISQTSTDGFSAGKRMEEHFGVK